MQSEKNYYHYQDILRMQNSKYLVANEQARKLGLAVSTVGHEHLKPFEPYPTGGHAKGYYFNTATGRILQEYQILFIVEGEGVFSSSHVTDVRVKAGNIIMLFPGEWHSYHPDAEVGWNLYWIGFKGDIINPYLNAGILSAEKPIYYVGQSLEITNLYESAIHLAEEEQMCMNMVLSGIVLHLIGMIHYQEQSLVQIDHDENIELITKARSLIRENIETDLSIQDIATQLGTSYSNLRKLFRKYTGMPPAQYQNELRLQEACNLVTYTNLPIKEIAYRLFFDTPQYFSITFKKKTGFTPHEYRVLSRRKE